MNWTGTAQAICRSSADTSRRWVAEQILQQLGGREFLTVTGCKQLVYDESSLRMKLTKNKSKANYLKITLGGNDLYEMLFFYYRPPKWVVKNGKVIERPEMHEEIARYEEVYCDMLQDLFTGVTGLVTRMPKITFQRGA